MEFYIRIKDGQPFEHPIFADNFRQAFPDVDIENLPSDFARFERVEAPTLGLHEVNEGVRYEWVDGIVKDVWTIRQMTDAEKAEKHQKVKDEWAARDQAENWSGWIFDESLCAYLPPFPRPDAPEGVILRWCGAENNWKEAPARPIDENQYTFDFFAWQWVLVVN